MLNLLFRPSNVSASTPGPASNFWYSSVPAGGTTSGEHVDADIAMRVAAVYACVRVLSEAVASLPLKLYRRREDGGKEVAGEHSLYGLLHDSPNGWMTSFEFVEQMMYHLCLRGNSISEKAYGSNGAINQLLPIHPERVLKTRMLGSYIIEYTYINDAGEKDTLTSHDVLHVRGLSSDGQWGFSPITLQRNAIAFAIGAEKFGASLWKNGVKPSGTLQVPGQLSDQAYARLRDSVAHEHGSSGNANKPMILEEGTTWSQISMTNEDAQFLETRKFQLAEIARIFRVPPHMIQDLERATFNNIEHMSLDFVTHSLRPWLVRIEQAIKRDLIRQSNLYFAEFTVDALLRGDTQSRYEAYASAIQNEWMSANEVRLRENMNPRAGGDDYRNPAINPDKQVSDQPPVAPQEKAADASPAQDQSASRLSSAISAWANDIAGRVATRELADLKKRVKHAKADREQFNEWAREYYTKHAEFVDLSLSSLCESTGLQESERVALVEQIAVRNMSELVASEDPASLVAEWSSGDILANRHKSSITGMVKA